MGLYALFFIHPVLMPLGFVGLLLTLFHMWSTSVWSSLVGVVHVDALDAIVCSLAYGFLGYVADRIHSRVRRSGE